MPGPPTPASSAVHEIGRPVAVAIVGELGEGEPAADGGLDHARAGIAERAGDGRDLGDVGGPARHRAALVADVGGDFDVAKPSAPASMASAHDGPHRGDLVGAWPRARSPSVAHDRQAHRRVADHRRHVDGRAPAPRPRRGTRGRSRTASRSPSPARSAAALMPSTFSSVRTMRSRCVGPGRARRRSRSCR